MITSPKGIRNTYPTSLNRNDLFENPTICPSCLQACCDNLLYITSHYAPSSCCFAVRQPSSAPGNEKHVFWGINSVDNFSKLVLYKSVQHIEMAIAENEKASYHERFQQMNCKKGKHKRHESTPDTRATVLTASITSPGSSSCLTRRCLSSTTSSNSPGVSSGAQWAFL